MPGFAALFEGNDHITLPVPGADHEYWVEVKKVLTWAEADAAEKAGMAFGVVPNMQDPQKTRTTVTVNPEAKLFEQVLASLVSWNLDDPDGKIWSLEYDKDLEDAHKLRLGGQGNAWKSARRKNLERMPKPYFDLVAAHVGSANQAPTEEEQKRFRPGNGSGPAGGEDERAGADEVLQGAELVAALGDTGGPPASP